MFQFTHRHDRTRSGGINMTPMIDVTFLLLTFFMLASHFASAERTAVDLPKPDENQAIDTRFEDKIIVNVLHVGDLTEPQLQLGPMPVASLDDLENRLGELARSDPARQVLLRADRRLAYGEVRQVMEVIAGAGLTHLQVVTELDATP